MADCTGGPVSCWIADQVDILSNIASTMPPVQRLISGAAYLLGIFFILKAVLSLKQFGESRATMSSNASLKEPLTYLLVGAMMLYLPTGVQMILNTAFGNSEYSKILAYAPSNSGNAALDTLFGPGSQVGASLTLIIQTIGLIAFIRGWVLIAKSASQGQSPGGMGKGFVHVLGGILAMNIVGTLEIINNTIYGG